MTIRTLILSGGGGRGAFHAGVYKYLCQQDKPGVDAAHQGGWKPDIVVGTSIGAVNGAAIAQGVDGETLARYWLALREHHVEGIPPGMRTLSRWVSNVIYRRILGVRLPVVAEAFSTSPAAQDSWPPLPLLPRALSERLIGRWNNLLDTGPLRRTLLEQWGIQEARLAESDTALLISATNVRTGELAVFSNRDIVSRRTGERRADLRTGITVDRILASCSIPLVYPWTRDSDGEVYWDGAVVANTPLGPALDAAAAERPIDEPMEAVVVLMTPWWEKGEEAPQRREELPADFGDAVTWTLDWALLASFRASLKLTRSYNELAAADAAAEIPARYRTVKDVIVAPQDFLPVTRIIDYDEPASSSLIDLGYAAAERAFQQHFGA